MTSCSNGGVIAWPAAVPESAIPSITPFDLGNQGANMAIVENEPIEVWPIADIKL